MSPLRYTPKNPRRNGFETTVGYDRGMVPACAINAKNYVVEVHGGVLASTLNLRIARVEGVALNFKDKAHDSFGNGNNPAVALHDNTVICMWDANRRLSYRTGTLVTSETNKIFRVDFNDVQQIGNQTDSVNATVAVNAAGIAVELHEQGTDVYWRRGRLEGTTLTWQETPTLLGRGNRPSVSINNNGQAVAVFQRDRALFYAVGTFTPTDTALTAAIAWTIAGTPYNEAGGVRPAVALTDDAYVIALHQSGRHLEQGVGTLAGVTISWNDFLARGQNFYVFDTPGKDVHVATNGKVAVQVHSRQVPLDRPRAAPAEPNLVGNACLLFDHANWMGDHRLRLSRKTLKSAALPASHDTGAFASTLAETQDLPVSGQLLYGIRYFDLRPRYIGPPNTSDVQSIVTFHNIFSGNYNGPRLVDVIREVREFMEGHKELVILKISHFFSGFNQQIFDKLAEAIVGDEAGTTGLRKWLFKKRPDATRLADRSLGDYLQETQGTVLVLVDIDTDNDDTDYVTEAHRELGIYKYRDWDARRPEDGDITVFDQFSSTPDFDTMALSESGVEPPLPGSTLKIKRGQLHKYDWFDGFCRSNAAGTGRSTTPCELFLLSWTVTPSLPFFEGTAFGISTSANRNLVSYLDIPLYQGRSAKGFHMNLLYTDAVELSRSVDVAMVRNDLLTSSG
ncbi:MAG TPA: hypothetical protein VGF28_19900 [Thermoanaerobaculia bacterium]